MNSQKIIELALIDLRNAGQLDQAQVKRISSELNKCLNEINEMKEEIEAIKKRIQNNLVGSD